MEKDQTIVESQEEISDSFKCCVCLELLYKPIVLPCGHVSCFWCVHLSMNVERESHCPLCRHEYTHFPTICEMFHFLLMKMYPVAYKRREAQVLDDEKESGFFSPQFDSHASGSHEDLASKEQSEICSEKEDYSANYSKQTCDGNSVEEKNFPECKVNGKHEKVSIADLLCAVCKQLLIHPVVLNCGHVFCETCINPADGLLRCQVCPSVNPRGIPKVFLQLDHFLKENFPEEYSCRRDAVRHKQILIKRENTSTSSKEADEQTPTGDGLPWWAGPDSKLHVGVGCDCCGMFPITGDRYRCKDCVEKAGFDLCGDCYNTRSKLPGRFNQQHTPEHKFELIKLKLKLVTLEDGTQALLIDDDEAEDPENMSPPPTSSGGPQNQTSDSLNASAILAESPEDEIENILHNVIFVDQPLENLEDSSCPPALFSDPQDDTTNRHTPPATHTDGLEDEDETESTN